MKPSPTKERRKYPRIEAKIKVTFHSVAELIEEYTRNISAGGIFLKTDRQLDPNATIDLTVEFPEKLGEFSVRGRVVRLMSISHPTKPGTHLYGAGIRFLQPDLQMVEAIEKLVSSGKYRKVD
jgi:uncharacterized protein (TIGR02266 family)